MSSLLLNKAAVCEKLAISPRCLEMMVRDRVFPPPVRLGRHVYWTETALNNWHTSAFAAQERWTPSGSRGQGWVA